MKIAMDFQNVIGANGLAVSMTGMLIVFSGLVLLSLFIGLLPRVLTFVTNVQLSGKKDIKESTAGASELTGEMEDEIAVAIGMVLHLEKERADLLSKNNETRDFWGTAGNMSTIPKRRLYA